MTISELENDSDLKMAGHVLFGFKAETAQPVYIEEHHSMINGMTQMAGKTTATWGFLSRWGVTSVVFITKRGESGFAHGCVFVRPFYKEWLDDMGFIDFRYIESLISVAMQGEKNRQYRSPIIDACEGATTLRQVLANAQKLVGSTKMAFDKAMLKQVIKILSFIIPEIERYNFSQELTLHEGKINVMDLRGLSKHVQGMIIRAVADEIKNSRENTVLVVPEAQKFVPNGLNSPAKQAVIELIQEGATLGNYVVVDSQAMRNVDGGIKQQTNNVIIGKQKDLNELQRTIKALESEEGLNLEAKNIKALKVGQFYVSSGDELVLAYAWPAWMPRQMAIKCAKDPEYVNSPEVRELANKVKQEAREIEAQHMAAMSKAKSANVRYQVSPELEVPDDSDDDDEEIVGNLDNAMITELQEKNKKLVQVNTELQALADRVGSRNAQLEAENKTLKAELDGVRKRVDEAVSILSEEEVFGSQGDSLPVVSFPEPTEEQVDALKESLKKGFDEQEEAKLDKPKKAILQFLAMREGKLFSVKQIAKFAGYSTSTSSFQIALSKLSTAGLVLRHGAKGIEVDKDRLADIKNILGEEYRAPKSYKFSEWRAKLDTPEGRIFDVLYSHKSKVFSVQELAEKAGYSPTTSSFQIALSNLSTLDIAVRERGKVTFNEQFELSS